MPAAAYIVAMDVSFVEQSGVIPWRDSAGGVEILMITSRRTGEWQVPKGSVEAHLGSVASAAEEGWEEAGARGVINPEPAGMYLYDKYYWLHQVTLYPLRVTEVQAEFLEAGERKLAWVPLSEAPDRVSNLGLAELLRVFSPSC